MKLSNKLNSLLVAPLAIALFAACSTDENLSDGGVSGQTLTFLALNAESEDAAGSRTIFDNTVGEGSTMDNVTAKWDATNDKVVVYGGNDYQNCGDFKVSKLSADGTTATLTGNILFFAHLLFPSIIIAICFGKFSLSIFKFKRVF